MKGKAKLFKSRKDLDGQFHKDGKVKAGQTYRRCTYRIIDDETGESWHKHTKRVVK